MMIHDFVEGKGFKELMQHLESRYVIPNRITFSRSVVPTIMHIHQQSKKYGNKNQIIATRIGIANAIL